MTQHYYCRQRFYDLATKHCHTPEIAEDLWGELVTLYSEKGRFYHTLNHVSGLVAVLETVLPATADPDAMLFAAVYHDAIYNVLRSDNEERSAELAQQRLNKLHVPAETTRFCIEHILATKKHESTTCHDTNLFIDADLSILGGTNPLYREYCANIRKEYSIYSDAEYVAGRRLVLEKFLAMPFIYKTEFFRNRYEVQARLNISAELTGLNR